MGLLATTSLGNPRKMSGLLSRDEEKPCRAPPAAPWGKLEGGGQQLAAGGFGFGSLEKVGHLADYCKQ